MALIEDMLKGNLVVAAAVGATALVLPKVLPGLSPPLRNAIKAGLTLFLESEAEAEGGIIDRLADNALQSVLKGLSAPGAPEDKKQAAQDAVEDFKRQAHRRARRYGHDKDDEARRYQRHIAALRRSMDKERARHAGGHLALEGLSATLHQHAQANAS